MPAPEKQPNRVNRTVEPAWLTKCIATVFYSGYSPVAPGTAGSLAALIPLILFQNIPVAVLGGMVIVGFVLGVWSSKQFELAYGDDPQIVVIDEAVGMWITMLLVPISWFTLIAGFVLFRLFDIIKVPPARQLEALRNGWGIMLDDVASGIYAGVTVFLITLLV